MKTIGLLVFTLMASKVFACGGGSIAESDVRNSVLAQKAQAKLEAVVGEELVLTTVTFSGNKILDIDKKVTVTAMCAAQYVNIYYQSGRDSRVTCYASGEVIGENKFYLSAGKCRLANGQLTDWIGTNL